MKPCTWCREDASDCPWEFGFTVLCQKCWERHCDDAWWEMVRTGSVETGHPALSRCFESRMDARGVMTLAPETREWIAAFLQAADVRPKCSTFIDDETITPGYGRLDEFGDWEFPL